MQLTPDAVLGLIVAAFSGAGGAWLGNRVVNAEIWGHIRKHCREIERCEKRIEDIDREVDALKEQIVVLRWRADHP